MSGPSKVNIKEANDHLKQLHQRVFELDNQLQLQAIHVEELQRANAQLQQKAQETVREKESVVAAKESQIASLTQRLQQSEEHVQKLLETAHERDAMVVKLEEKARLFYEVVEHKPVLARMVDILKELSQEQEEEQISPGVKDGGRTKENGNGNGGGKTGTGSTLGDGTASSPDTAERSD